MADDPQPEPNPLHGLLERLRQLQKQVDSLVSLASIAIGAYCSWLPMVAWPDLVKGPWGWTVGCAAFGAGLMGSRLMLGLGLF